MRTILGTTIISLLVITLGGAVGYTLPGITADDACNYYVTTTGMYVGAGIAAWFVLMFVGIALVSPDVKEEDTQYRFVMTRPGRTLRAQRLNSSGDWEFIRFVDNTLVSWSVDEEQDYEVV